MWIAAWVIVGPQRRWALASSVLLAGAVLASIPTQRDLHRIQRDWDAWQRDAAARGLEAFKRALDASAERSVATVHVALGVSRDRTRAFSDIAPLSGGGAERGVVLYRGDSAFAWAGTIKPNIDPIDDGMVVVGTPFYLGLQYAERSPDGSRAVAVALLDAAPPADKLSDPLATRVADDVGLRGFIFDAPAPGPPPPDVLHYAVGGRRMFDVRASALPQGAVSQRVLERGRVRAGVAFAFALVCFIIGVWRATRGLVGRLAVLAVGIACTALIPFNQYSNLTRLFDPSVYFTPQGGPLTANAGALTMTAALVLLGVLAVFRRTGRRVSRPTAVLTVLVVVGLGPFLLRDLARGVTIPAHGVDAELWLTWEVPLFLAAVSVLLAGASAGAALLGPRRGLQPWVAPLAAAVAALIAQVVWEVPGSWPWWYTLFWVAAIGMLALSRRTRFVIASAAAVAALGATTLVWARTARGRVDAAQRDLAGLGEADSVSVGLLRRMAVTLAANPAPQTRRALLQHFVTSDVAAAGNPVALSAWPTDSGPIALFETARIPLAMKDEALAVRAARESGQMIVEAVPTDTALEVVMAVPSVSGGVTAAVLAPKSRMFEPDPFAALLGLDVDTDAEPPYTVRLRQSIRADTTQGAVSWRREGTVLHGDWVGPLGAGASAAHVEVELRSLDALVERGVLIVGLDLAIVGLLWFASVVADGGAGRWIRARRRRWGRSYRARLSLALFAFFTIPAAAFAAWSYEQLATDATRSRELLVRETLRSLDPPAPGRVWLPSESDRLSAPLLVYRGGALADASDGLYAELAPLGRYLDPRVEARLGIRGEETTTQVDDVDGTATLFGYRQFDTDDSLSTIVASPARGDDLPLGRRRRDLGVLVLFSTAIGAVAALWLSGIAARQLARPIAALRYAAMSIAAGARELPFESEPTVEFSPVFTAFRIMAADLSASTAALEEAQRRTAAVLRNVASGVIAVDADGRVTLANPRAEALLAASLEPGVLLTEHAPKRIAAVVEHFLNSGSDEETFELSLEQQQIRGTLTRLGRGGATAVVTLDDVTELARAQRVLAWGEMARQVAHEIKNPLTPIRLGVQHLRRARADARIDFDRVLDHNVNQILAEIDRLDEIARSFSRYGAAPDDRPRPIPVDVAAVVREVVSLERMGDESSLRWHEDGVDGPIGALARGDELKEVLLNVLENARLADARSVRVSVAPKNGADPARVVITVRDDGHGLPADVLPRIFEPHFSTRTSGSGLGLAISRR
ncbi:MAG TPA: ATP-binding protein, partial [Gemmatimonadaceae bacterium]|nr:ATP-binding protein [Gemmatimonadaceae bacterium]